MNKDKTMDRIMGVMMPYIENSGGPHAFTARITAIRTGLTELLAELEVADSPDMDGLRRDIVDAAVMTFNLGPEDQDEALRFAMKVEDILKAGRSSLTGIDIEQEARKWMFGERLNPSFMPHGNEPQNWNMAQYLSAFARFILSIKDGKGGGDAVQSDGPRSAAVPSEADRPAAAPPIAIAKDKKRPFDLEKLRKEVGHQPHFFPSDVYPHNSRFKRWCQKQAALGNLIRHGEHGDRWGYNYSFPSLPSPPSQAPTP